MDITAILTRSTMRHFPNAPMPKKALPSIEAALNERFSFQLAIRAGDDARVAVSAEAPDGWTVRIRRVGLVPVPHHNLPVLSDPLDTDGIGQIPGYVPDPLFDEQNAILVKDETTAFWFTVTPPKDARPGRYRISLVADLFDRWDASKPIGKPIRRPLSVTLRNVVIKPRQDFDVMHWFYSDCLVTRYGAEVTDERFWEILPAYLKDIVEHGQNVVYVPIFTPPLDSDKHPSQLLCVKRKGKDKYAFDWTLVRRYVRLAKKCGIDKFEWCHLFSQWGCKRALRIFEGNGEGEKRLWPEETEATSKTYRAFLSQFLPELQKFLKEERILAKSVFHISDEPHGDEAKAAYGKARAMIRELAPWITAIDALSDISFAKEGLVDSPVPILDKAVEFLESGIDCYCYYCCGPRGEYLQHLMDTPLAKIAMHGFLFYRWPFKGFLHWGLNYWNECQKRKLIDPYTVSDGGNWEKGWAYGDTFLIYPGEKGPVDSIRWEVFSEAMQDYALLQTVGLDRASELLADIKSFSDFPKEEIWRFATKTRLYALGEAASGGGR